MTKYLLTCNCGAKHPVEPGQAGKRISCPCGATLEVPSLRKMRHLPLAAPAPDAATRAKSSWNVRKGLVATFLLVSMVLALMAAWSWYIEPRVAEFDPEAYRVSVDHGVENMTPEQSWQWWVQEYRPLAERGFAKFQDAHASHIEAIAARHEFMQKSLLAVAAVFSVLAAATAFWPMAKTRRQGEGATRRRR